MVDEVLNLPEGLGFSLAQVLASAFVLDEDDARPKEIDVAIFAGEVLDRLFKTSYCTPAYTEGVEKFIPEALLFTGFAFGSGPFLGEGDGAVANLVPRKRHGEIVTKTSAKSRFAGGANSKK